MIRRKVQGGIVDLDLAQAAGASTHPHDRLTQPRVPTYKRPFDLGVGALLVLLTAPLSIVLAALVKLTSRGPVLFQQERIGLAGKSFQMYKFRTMYHGADAGVHREYFKYYMKGAPAPGQDSTIFKLRRDPRITRIGGALRRLGLDELPQLINVMRGDMSLVGPRPPLEYEVEHYAARHLRRLTVKPGCTGLWQVRGRDMVDFESMIDMDLAYIDRQSLLLDIRLCLETVPALIWAFLRH